MKTNMAMAGKKKKRLQDLSVERELRLIFQREAKVQPI